MCLLFFLVDRNDPKYQKISHKFKLNFMGMTKIEKYVVDGILENNFQFAIFIQILVANKDDKIIGYS